MKFLLALAALFGGALLLAAPASAHASLVSSTPANGARLTHAPTSVTLQFDEQVGLGGEGYLHVIDEGGTRVEVGKAVHPGGNGTKVMVTLKSGLGDGTFTSSYRVVSADSHPIAGVVRFVVGTGPLVTTTTESGSSDSGVAAIFDTTRWISWAGFALLGGGWLLLTVWPAGRDDRRACNLVWGGWALAALGAMLEFLLQGVYAAGTSVVHVFNPTLIDATLHTDYGQLHSLRLLLLGLMAVVFGQALQPGQVRERLDDGFWLLGLGIAYTFAAAGHATTTSPSWLSIVADTLHLSAMAVWVGGLVMVLAALLPRGEQDELRETLPVFSRAAFASVVVLAVTGTYAAWRGIGSVRAILHTEYGLLIAGKVVLFCGLLALGNLSRRVIQRRIRRPVVAFAMTDDVTDDVSGDVTDHVEPHLDDVSAERMRRGLIVEVALAAVVLALTAVLVSQPRGAEALAAQDLKPITATAPLGGGQSAVVTVNPGRHGAVTVTVSLTDGVHAKSLTGTATQAAKQLGPIPLKLSPEGKNLYTAGGVDLPVAGTWDFALVVTASQFSATTTDVKITLK